MKPPCDNCLVKVTCRQCCLEQQLWSDTLNIKEKLKYLDSMKNQMKIVSPQIRREFNKTKYGMEF